MVRDRSCTSTELQSFLWKLKVWSSGEGSNKFPIRQEDGSEITAQSYPKGDLPFGSFRGHRTRSVCSYASPFWGSCCLVPWHTCGHITFCRDLTRRYLFSECRICRISLCSFAAAAELDHCLMFPLGSKNSAASRNAGSCRLRDVMVGLLPIISF